MSLTYVVCALQRRSSVRAAIAVCSALWMIFVCYLGSEQREDTVPGGLDDVAVIVMGRLHH
jgi:hypothetical protein